MGIDKSSAAATLERPSRLNQDSKTPLSPVINLTQGSLSMPTSSQLNQGEASSSTPERAQPEPQLHHSRRVHTVSILLCGVICGISSKRRLQVTQALWP